MRIDRHEARRIAALAHLEFDDDGLDRMAAEMTRILEYIDSLPASAPQQTVSGSPEGQRPDGAGAGLVGLRPDTARSSIDRQAVARNAPEWEDGFFIVPAVIEEST